MWSLTNAMLHMHMHSHDECEVCNDVALSRQQQCPEVMEHKIGVSLSGNRHVS